MEIQENIPLANHTTFHIGGSADYFLEIGTKQDLIDALIFSKEKNLKPFFLGGGSNILFSDNGFRGVIIKMKNNALEMRDGNIWAESGTLIAQLVQFAKKNEKDLSGFLAIPGTLGGAITGNAGTPGWETADYLLEAEIFDSHTGEFFNVEKDWFQYDYRNSKLHTEKEKRYIVWSGLLSAPNGTHDKIQENCNKMMKLRREKQPAGLSAGSFFKNHPESEKLPQPKNTAGWMLDQIGAKGQRAGGAIISELHANFFQNEKGDATQQDVIELARKLLEKVNKSFGIRLIPEVKIYDEFGEIIDI